MIKIKLRFYLSILITCLAILNSQAQAKEVKMNPVVYFEIPATDIKRAISFYSSVFGFDFEIEEIDGYQMALFPLDKNAQGITGALAKGDVYIPSLNGPIIYFGTDDIHNTLKKAVKAGAKILYPVKSNGPLGFVAEFQDSEGNRIALHQRAN
jgi:predicted enzyme related to lactoylglutathione lyase